MKKILLSILIALFAVSLFSQTVTVARKSYDWSADSTSYFEFYIDLPETVTLDTTMQITMWNYSSEGAVSISLYWAPAFHFTDRARTGEYDILTSVTLVSSKTTESAPLTYRTVIDAGDDCENDASIAVAPNAIYVKVDAEAGNRDDGYGYVLITAPKKEN